MADEDGQPNRVLDAGTVPLGGSGAMSAQSVQIHAIEHGFPPATLPTIFADGIANAAPSVSAVKLYLYRSDPEQAGAGEYKSQVIAQIVMPMAGFVHASAFLEKAVKHFVSRVQYPMN